MYSTLKNYITFVIILTIVGFVLYSEYMMGQLERETETVSRIYGKFIGSAQNEDAALNIIFSEVIQRVKFPVVVVDTMGNIIASTNIEKDQEERVIKNLRRTHEPVVVEYEGIPLCTVYYGETRARAFLKQAPYIQIGVALLLLVIALIWFRGMRKTEETMIWAGIAKETAHQLGTPLSSLMAWMEYIKDPKLKKEMTKDIVRLEEVSERFSRIGSVSFKYVNLNEILSKNIDYVKKRIPFIERRLTIKEDFGVIPHSKVDDGLMSWAFENILKNAVDAEASIIEVRTQRRGRYIRITVMDNGKGVKKKDIRRLFDAGYTTKEYGWGMGLSLTKRIIDLHRGRIYCNPRQEGGTSFIIQLPIHRATRRAKK